MQCSRWYRWSVWLLLWCTSGAALGDETVRVMAASSLTDVLEAVADDFDRGAGQSRTVLTFAGSSRLARQLDEGASADVVLTANAQWMDRLEEQGHIVPDTRVDLLGNTLVVVVPAEPGGTLSGLTDLTGPAWSRVAIAGEAVPGGQYARESLESAGMLATLWTRLVIAGNVRAVLALVAHGEVDAGFVYETDAAADPRVRIAHVVRAERHRPIRYPVALTPNGQRSPLARSFLAYLQSDDATAHYTAAGFLLPPAGAVPARPPRSVAPPRDGEVVPPLAVSLWVASISLMLSIVPAIVLGWLLARREFRGKSLLSTLLLAPLALPPVVTGYLLLRAFGRRGWFAPVMDALGVEVAFTRWGAVAAAAVVGFPLLLILVRQAIESVDPRYSALAETLGLRPLQAFWRVTLPMALPGIAAGCVLAFARALGEFGATAMIAGDQPGETRTLALAVYALVERPSGEAAAATLVWISLALSFGALLVYERLVWRQRRRTTERP